MKEKNSSNNDCARGGEGNRKSFQREFPRKTERKKKSRSERASWKIFRPLSSYICKGVSIYVYESVEIKF